jgi:uncharacterized membrane protein YesL
MGKLFDPNNPIMRGLTDIANIILLSCAWLIGSLGIITIGPATAALYYVTQKLVEGENPKIFRSFFHSFRENLKQGMILTLIFGITAALLGYDYLFSYMVNESLGKLLRIVFVVAAAVWLMLACYTFPLQAQFQNRIKITLQNALFLALSHLGQTITVMLIHLVPVAVCLALPELFARLLPLWIFAAPGLIAFLCTLRLRKLWASLRQQAQAETAPEETQ